MLTELLPPSSFLGSEGISQSIVRNWFPHVSEVRHIGSFIEEDTVAVTLIDVEVSVDCNPGRCGAARSIQRTHLPGIRV